MWVQCPILRIWMQVMYGLMGNVESQIKMFGDIGELD